MKLTITLKVEIDLDDLPEGVKFITVDQDGTITCFSERPHFEDGIVWVPHGDDNWDTMYYANSRLDDTENALIDIEKLLSLNLEGRDAVLGLELSGTFEEWDQA